MVNNETQKIPIRKAGRLFLAVKNAGVLPPGIVRGMKIKE
jgi:hypothetical protein